MALDLPSCTLAVGDHTPIEAMPADRREGTMASKARRN
jgi:hypothetical protein